MTFGRRLRAYFLAGILITAPVGITLYLAWLFVTFIDDWVNALLPARFNPETYLPFSVPGLGVVIIVVALVLIGAITARSEEHTSELQSLMRISYAVFCLKKKTKKHTHE